MKVTAQVLEGRDLDYKRFIVSGKFKVKCPCCQKKFTFDFDEYNSLEYPEIDEDREFIIECTH